MKDPKHDPFYRPTEPKNNWELLRWVVFDYELMKTYERGLSRRNKRLKFISTYFKQIIPISFFLWLLWGLGNVLFDVPTIISSWCNPSFIENWNLISEWGNRLVFIYLETIVDLIIPIIIIFLLGLIIGLDMGLVMGLAFGLGGL